MASMGQGCVAIRGFTSCSPSAFTNSNLIGKGWQLSTNYRYFESFRHFRGTHEEPERVENHTEVVNYTTQLSFGLTYNLNKREGVGFILPYSYFLRRSLYEHGRTERHSTHAAGLGDVRISYNYWLWHPDSATRGNLMLSGGIKASAVFEFPNGQVIRDMVNGAEFHALDHLRREAYKKVDLMLCDAL